MRRTDNPWILRGIAEGKAERGCQEEGCSGELQLESDVLSYDPQTRRFSRVPYVLFCTSGEHVVEVQR